MLVHNSAGWLLWLIPIALVTAAAGWLIWRFST
jgi:hypothetical protein